MLPESAEKLLAEAEAAPPKTGAFYLAYRDLWSSAFEKMLDKTRFLEGSTIHVHKPELLVQFHNQYCHSFKHTGLFLFFKLLSIYRLLERQIASCSHSSLYCEGKYPWKGASEENTIEFLKGVIMNY